MRKKINRSSDGYTAIPNDLLNDPKLSFEAKGLAMYAAVLDNTEAENSVASIKFWKAIDDTNAYAAYKELVDAEYINDVIGGGKP
jgi:hypothetical protein